MIGNSSELQFHLKKVKELSGIDLERLRNQLVEMQSNPFHTTDPDGKIIGFNCRGCARLQTELNDALAALKCANTSSGSQAQNSKS
jgi:hypothetical protein